MRLVLLPIVYNAMAAKEHLHSHPLFVAMDREMRKSSYWPLVSHPSDHGTSEENGARSSALFSGPRHLATTIAKYMFLFPSLEEVETTKRLRTTFVDTMKMSSQDVKADAPSAPRPPNTAQDDRTAAPQDTPEDLAGAKGLFDMLISGNRTLQQVNSQSTASAGPARSAAPDYRRQLADLQASINFVSNEVSFVKASLISLMQMVHVMMQRNDSE